MSSLPTTPEIPGIETFPVAGESGAITVTSGHLIDGSHVLAGQGQQVTTIAGSLSTSWTGQAASGYQSFSGLVAGAFMRAATEIETAATLLGRYATELANFQQQAKTAADQSTHWHGQITTWTTKLNDAKNAVTRAQTDLTTAEQAYTSAAAKGPAGAGAAAAASGAITAARTALTTAQQDVTAATRALTRAHEEFTIWQERGRRIQAEAKTAGEELARALIAITIVPPPLPGAPDYPPLEPSPGILLNSDGGEGGQGGDGEGGQGDQGGQGEGGQKDGEKDPQYPHYRAWKDENGKWHIEGTDQGPPPTATQGDPAEQRRKDEQFLQGLRDGKPKEPPSVLLGQLLSGFIHPPHT